MKPIKVNLKEGAWILYKQKKGYEVLPHKAQICKQEVAYLGFFPKQGTRSWMANSCLLYTSDAADETDGV